MINKNKKFLLFTIILVFVFLFSWRQYSRAQSASIIASPDAIAVRIIPNPNHYSIDRWYANQGFQGSPQSLVVDGYQAIRDGRTVYVNAANVNPTTKTIYTNIYLISYNQNPAPKTVDILGQIISHWKFNNNLSSNILNAPATCSISTFNCTSNSDCSSGQYCATSGAASSTCILKTPKDCLSDADCSTGFFCNSLKSQVTRDVRRVGLLTELKIALNNFKLTNQHYPLLSAGTYLPHNSVSLWPSWSKVLLSDLAVSPSLVDPINHLGACTGYNSSTCWNPQTKKFFSNPSNSTLILPRGSYAFAYASNGTGSDYNLCASLETKALNYNFYPLNPQGSACVIDTGIISGGTSSNIPPVLVNKFLTGQTGQEFNGFIQVQDANHDPLSWSLSPVTTNWTGWNSAGQKNHWPILKNTSSLNQKNVFAETAGNAGAYQMLLTVKDGRGGTLSTVTPITILSSSLIITASNGEYVLDSNLPFSYHFSISGRALKSVPRYTTSSQPNTYYVSQLTGPAGFNLLSSLTRTISSTGNYHYQITYQAKQLPISKLSSGANFTYRIRVTDADGNSVTKDFSLKIIPSHLGLNINCSTITRISNVYNCSFPLINKVTYSASGLPAGLSISDSGLTGTPTVAGSFPITIQATNQYKAQAVYRFKLTVNTYCGDGRKEAPNSEGSGGFNNDGNESCDGLSGITANPTLSNVHLQYACQTGVGAQTPYPILTNDQCIFSSPLQGGGYCGDGYCQALSASNKSLETCNSCAQDCGACADNPEAVIITGTVNSYAYYAHPSKTLPGVKIVVGGQGNIITQTTTDSQGKYSLTIPPVSPSYSGSYTATASLYGYDNTIQSFDPRLSKIINFIMSTPSYQGTNKISLTWGASPRDLDSHLTFGTSYHVWYQNHNVASSSLDIDVQSGYGPENIRIQKYIANNYKYDVFNYSACGGYGFSEIPFGTTTVTIYDSHNGITKVYHANPTQTSCYWHVFGLDSQGNITTINTYNNTGPPYN